MSLTKSDIKVAIQEHRSAEFHTFLKNRRPARQAEIEGERLARDRMQPNGVTKRDWVVTLPDAAMYPKIFEPAFWLGCGDKLQISDCIEFFDDMLTLHARCVVVACDQTRSFIELRELTKIALAPAVVSEEIISGYETKYSGLHKKWEIYRRQDGHLMSSGIPSKHEAMELIRTNYKTLKS